MLQNVGGAMTCPDAYVHSPTLNRSEYVLVGSVFVLLAAASYFAISATVDWIDLALKSAKKRAWRATIKQTFYAVSAILVPAFALSILSGFRLQMWDWRILLSIFMLGSLARYARQAARHLESIWNQYLDGSPTSNEYHPFAHKFTALFEVIFSIPSVIVLYVILTFPHIQSVYGGGIPLKVRVTPTKHGAEVFSLLKIPIGSSGDAGPFYLVSESDSEMYITSSVPEWRSGTVTRLKKSLLDAIVTVHDDDDIDPKRKVDNPVSPPAVPIGSDPKPNVPPPSASPSPSAQPTS
jgi:hypothetical protein